MAVDDLGETLRITDGTRGSAGCGESVTLVFLEGPHAGQVVPIDRTRTVVGRRGDADLTIPSRSVSKEHCVLFVDSGIVEVEDLGSTNGVAVNGNRVAQGARRRLFHGDSLRLGESLALVHLSGCFQDTAGASRIQIDRAKVASEADALMEEFTRWTKRG